MNPQALKARVQRLTRVKQPETRVPADGASPLPCDGVTFRHAAAGAAASSDVPPGPAPPCAEVHALKARVRRLFEGEGQPACEQEQRIDSLSVNLEEVFLP